MATHAVYEAVTARHAISLRETQTMLFELDYNGDGRNSLARPCVTSHAGPGQCARPLVKLEPGAYSRGQTITAQVAGLCTVESDLYATSFPANYSNTPAHSMYILNHQIFAPVVIAPPFNPPAPALLTGTAAEAARKLYARAMAARHRLATAAAMRADVVAQMRDDLDAEKATNAALRGDITAKDSEIAGLTADSIDYLAQIKGLTTDNTAHLQKIADLTAKIAGLENDVAVLTGNNIKLDADIKDRGTKIDDLENKLNAKMATNPTDAVRNLNDKLKAENTALQVKQEELEAQVKTAAATLDTTNKTLTVTKQELADAIRKHKVEIDEYLEDITNKFNMIQRLSAEVEALKPANQGE